MNGIAARSMDENADAEVANFQPADVDPFGIDER
jgi:hypothetical protein